jgi:hypothetical protein
MSQSPQIDQSTRTEAHNSKIDWSELSSNPAAMDLLRINSGNIDWKRLSYNPALFVSDIDSAPDTQAKSGVISSVRKMMNDISNINPMDACLFMALLVCYNCLIIIVKRSVDSNTC